MIHRMLFSVGAMLIGAGLAFAQPDVEKLVTPPTPVTDAAPLVVPLTQSEPVSRGERNFWTSADYMYSWFRGGNLPPLVTTSPAGTDRTVAGIIGGNTTTLFGDSPVNGSGRSGMRFQAGIWLNSERTLGVEAGFTVFEGQSTNFSANSDQFPILARPYNDGTDNTKQAVLVAFPGSSNGSISVQAISANLYEAHFDLTEKAVDLDWFRVTSLFGYRFFHYNDSLRAQQTIAVTDPNFVPGTTLQSNDNFSVSNDFQGIDMGFRAQFYWQNLSLELLGKVAFGNLHQVVGINGNQTVTVPGTPVVTQNFGVLALPSNIGMYHFNEWWSLPEGGATLSWSIRPNLQVRLGYSVLVLNGVARAGNQIDTTINPALYNQATATPMRPQFSLTRSDLWIQTINLGVVFTY